MGYFELLSFTVAQYLTELKKRHEAQVRSHRLMLLNEDGDKPAIVFCKPNDTLAVVIKMLNYYHVHRVFIVDSQFKPVGKFFFSLFRFSFAHLEDIKLKLIF